MPNECLMITALVILFVLLLVGTVVFFEAGDILFAKLRPGTQMESMGLPFLVVPVMPSEPAITPLPFPRTMGNGSWTSPAIQMTQPRSSRAVCCQSAVAPLRP
jgi:hypothetical protein